jgi:hypothetical protein
MVPSAVRNSLSRNRASGNSLSIHQAFENLFRRAIGSASVRIARAAQG